MLKLKTDPVSGINKLTHTHNVYMYECELVTRGSKAIKGYWLSKHTVN